MQIFLLIYYFLRSAVLRGLINTIVLLLAESKFEKQFGIVTAKVKRSKSKEYFHYQGASYLVLSRIFKKLEPYLDFQFIDIGCGKGRVVFVAEQSGFKTVAGIELDAELLEQAEKNKSLHQFKTAYSNVRFIHQNALNFQYEDTKAVYFLFNPFNEEILRAVLKRINGSSGSETIFVYMNPLYPKPFYDLKLEQIDSIKTRFYTEALIFRMPAKIT